MMTMTTFIKSSRLAVSVLLYPQYVYFAHKPPLFLLYPSSGDSIYTTPLAPSGGILNIHDLQRHVLRFIVKHGP